MKLRIFLPAADRLDPERACAWILFDGVGGVLREGSSPVAEMPRTRSVELVLPAQRVLFARLRLPRVNAATIRELLPYAVEDRLLADPAQIHAVAGGTNERGETIVEVVDRDWLAAMADALAREGFGARTAWCESELLERAPSSWQMAWGRARGLLVDDEGVAATFDPGEGVPLALRIALDESAARGERPAVLRVHAEGGAPLPDLARWSAECGLRCEPAEAWEQAMRASPRTPLNLLQGELAPRTGISWRIPRPVVALVAAIVAVQVTFTALDTWRLQRERDALDARREAVFREAFPEARVVVDPELQMARNLADLQRTRGLPGGDEFLVQMTREAQSRGSPPRTVEFANGRLTTK
jgi:general secretion pathway protein L